MNEPESPIMAKILIRFNFETEIYVRYRSEEIAPWGDNWILKRNYFHDVESWLWSWVTVMTRSCSGVATPRTTPKLKIRRGEKIHRKGPLLDVKKTTVEEIVHQQKSRFLGNVIWLKVINPINLIRKSGDSMLMMLIKMRTRRSWWGVRRWWWFSS